MPYFQTDEQKSLVLKFIKQLKIKNGIGTKAFSIMINHLHILFHSKTKTDVTLVKNFIQGNVTREYRSIYEVKGSDFWHPAKTLPIKNNHLLGLSILKLSSFCWL